MGKLVWILLVIALIGEFIIPYILAFFYPKYNHKQMVMSILGNRKSPVHTYYNTWLIIFGVVMLLSGVEFFYRYQDVSKTLSILGAIILSIYGIGGCILSGIFSVNETRNVESTSEKIHGIGAGLGFMFLLFISLIIGLLYIKIGEILIGTLSVILFVISILLFVIFIMSEKDKFQGTIIGYSGLWQRLLLGCMYLPLFIISLMASFVEI